MIFPGKNNRGPIAQGINRREEYRPYQLNPFNIFPGFNNRFIGIGILDFPIITYQSIPQNTSIIPKKYETIIFRGLNITLPLIPEQFIDAYVDTFEIQGNISIGRLSTMFTMMLNSTKIPDNIVDRLILSANDSSTPCSVYFHNDAYSLLTNLFPMHTPDTINKIISSTNYQMQLAVLNLDRIKPTRTSSSFKRTAKIILHDGIIAAGLKQYMRLVERVSAKIEQDRQTKEQELQEKQRYEKAISLGSVEECQCCFETFPKEDVVKCTEGHSFCKKCVRKQIETIITEGRSDLKCLNFGGCDGIISISELDRTMPPKVIERLYQTETLNAAISAGLNILKCFNCGYGVIYEGSCPMICPKCSKSTCNLCGEEAHPGISCDDAKPKTEESVEEKMNDAVVRTCPRCHTQFMKEDGCNKMECPRCHAWICYWCRKEIPRKEGYNHFWRDPGPCPPDRCPLWVKNETLHVVEAQKVLVHAQNNQ